MKMGPKRFPFTLEANAPTTERSGQKVANWTAVGTYWSEFRQTGESETQNADRLETKSVYVIKTRYQGVSINPSIHRLTQGARIFNIRSANNVDGRNREWELTVVEVQNPR